MVTGDVTYKEVEVESWRSGRGPHPAPETLPASAAQADVDWAEREDETPGTARTEM